MKLTRFIATAAFLFTIAAGCHHAPRTFRPAIDPEMMKMSKEQLFDRGEQFFARKRFQKARTYYSYVYENFPNDPFGRRALLRVADTFYAQADPVNLVEAQYKYRDFINRYPGSDRADYAMLQIANVAYLQMEKPDRDQQKTHEAVEKYQDMLRAYPKSSLRPEGEKRLQDALDRLGRHEHLVAKYYIKRGSFDAAVLRLNRLVEQYPNYRDRDAVFYDLGTALERLGRKGEARLYFERVLSEFPKSQYADKARRRLDTTKA
ncbi:MAG: outer membrane protein assembly factor BamD [Acidobacteriota bacterium]